MFGWIYIIIFSLSEASREQILRLILTDTKSEHHTVNDRSEKISMMALFVLIWIRWGVTMCGSQKTEFLT